VCKNDWWKKSGRMLTEFKDVNGEEFSLTAPEGYLCKQTREKISEENDLNWAMEQIDIIY
jgi:hypothetical protein